MRLNSARRSLELAHRINVGRKLEDVEGTNVIAMWHLLQFRHRLGITNLNYSSNRTCDVLCYPTT